MVSTPRDRGGDVQQQQALDFAAQHAGLDGGTDGHALVRVDALEGVLADEVLHGLLHGGDTGRTAHQQHLADLVDGQAGVGQSLTHGAHGLLHQVGGELVELGPGEGHVQVLGAGGVGGDEGQVDGGAGHAGELDLGLLGSLFNALHGHLVARQVDALLHLEAREDPVHNPLVEVVAAQAVVAGGGQHFLDAVAHLDDGHVEGAAAQVVDHDLLVVVLVHAVREGRGGGLVDNPLHVQAGDLAGVLGGLALGVGEVRGHGDDRAGDRLAQVSLGVGLQLLEDHGGDLLGGVALAVDGHLVVRAHLPLDGGDGALGVGDGLALGHLAHHALAGLGERHHRGGGAGAFRVGDDHGLAALDDSHAGVCSA